MTVFSPFSDVEVELVLRGVAPHDEEPSGGEGLSGLADAIGALRAAAELTPAPAMSPTLRATLRSRVDASRPRSVLGRAASWASAAAAVSALVAGLGLGAAENMLPADLQDVVASTAGRVGIELPHADDREVPETETADHGVRARRHGSEHRNPPTATPASPGTPGDHVAAVHATSPDSDGDNGSPATGSTGSGEPATEPPEGTPQGGVAPQDPATVGADPVGADDATDGDDEGEDGASRDTPTAPPHPDRGSKPDEHPAPKGKQAG